MAAPRHLAKAPIAEAIIDLRTSFDGGGERDLSALGPKLGATYAKRETRRTLQVTIKDAKSETVVEEAGFLYRSEDAKHVVQVKPDGFAFSRLEPYESWNALVDAAWGPWLLYRDEFRPARVTRVSTRFINRLRLEGVQDFDEFLTAMPRIPLTIPQRIAAFSSAVAVPEVLPGTMVKLRTSLEASGSDTTIIILDIDVMHELGEVDPRDDATIRKSIDSLRVIKNDAFFGSVTERALEQFA